MRGRLHPDHYLRYKPVLDLVDRLRPASILDAGCGSWGIGAFTDQPFTGCDVVFAPPVCPTMRAVNGSILALPFADHSFDLVICSDALEHIPPSQRATAIAELVRVSDRHLWLACPTGSVADATDRAIAARRRARGKALPPWLDEHLRHPFPRADEIAAALAATPGSLQITHLENWRVHTLIVEADLRPLRSRAMRLPPRRFWDGVARWGNGQPTYRTAFHLIRAAE